MGMSIWFGVRSSVCQMVIERLDGTYNDRNEVGQYPLYNKVAGVVVTGNEDGAHASAETTLFNLTHLGCVVPPNADTYWVGDAGPGPSYLDAGGPRAPVHPADELVVRPQPAAHGTDNARQPDSPDRQHARRNGRGRRARRLAGRHLGHDPDRPQGPIDRSADEISVRERLPRCRSSVSAVSSSPGSTFGIPGG